MRAKLLIPTVAWLVALVLKRRGDRRRDTGPQAARPRRPNDWADEDAADLKEVRVKPVDETEDTW